MKVTVDTSHRVTIRANGRIVIEFMSEGVNVWLWTEGLEKPVKIDQTSLRYLLESVLNFSGYQGDEASNG